MDLFDENHALLDEMFEAWQEKQDRERAKYLNESNAEYDSINRRIAENARQQVIQFRKEQEAEEQRRQEIIQKRMKQKEAFISRKRRQYSIVLTFACVILLAAIATFTALLTTDWLPVIPAFLISLVACSAVTAWITYLVIKLVKYR